MMIHRSFNERLEGEDSVTIHHRNIQSLPIELFKVKLGVTAHFRVNHIL